MIFLTMPVFGILISLGTIHLGDTSPIKPNLEETGRVESMKGIKIALENPSFELYSSRGRRNSVLMS